MKELRCDSRMAAVRCGLSSVVPLHVLTVMTPLDMEIRTCGLPSLDLGFLKVCHFYPAIYIPHCLVELLQDNRNVDMFELL